MKRLMQSAAIVLAACVACAAGAAQFPEKPMRFVVGNAPGGGTDLMARVIAQKLSDTWGTPVVVDNRPGGTGAVGSGIVAKAPADGHTLLMATNSSHAIAPNVQKGLPYHPVRDFAPVALVATGPNLLVAHPSVAAASVKDLVTAAKARPGTLNYASPGIGSMAHMAMELFKAASGTDFVHVPYKGSAAAMNELLGGHVQLTFSGPGPIVSHAESGRVKVLAVASARRVEGFENVPTFAEAGYPEVDAPSWYGVFTTAGSPPAAIAALNREIVRILQMPEVRKQFAARGYIAAPTTPEEFGRLVKGDLLKWEKVVKSSGLSGDK